MRRVKEKNMKNILIICAGDNKKHEKLIEYAKKSDYIICADGGYQYAVECGITPNILVGDFDSMEEPKDFFLKVRLPKEKDETDTEYALKTAFSKNPDTVIIYGGIGDRFDHSYANVCLLNSCLEHEIKAFVTDGKTKIYLTDCELILNEKTDTTISIYSFSDISEGVSIEGFKYPLNNATLSKFDVVGTSNLTTAKKQKISVENGILMIICNEI